MKYFVAIFCLAISTSAHARQTVCLQSHELVVKLNSFARTFEKRWIKDGRLSRNMKIKSVQRTKEGGYQTKFLLEDGKIFVAEFAAADAQVGEGYFADSVSGEIKKLPCVQNTNAVDFEF